jgi:hypothetical protein
MDRNKFWELSLETDEDASVKDKLISVLIEIPGHIVLNAMDWSKAFLLEHLEESLKRVQGTESQISYVLDTDDYDSSKNSHKKRLRDIFYQIALSLLSEREELFLDQQAKKYGLYTPSPNEIKMEKKFIGLYEKLGMNKEAEKLKKESRRDSIDKRRKTLLGLLYQGQINL